MGLIDWALKGHHKKLRESEHGRALVNAFQASGFNDGTAQRLQVAADLYRDFNVTIGAANYVPQDVAQEFASITSNSRWPILFNVALDYALNCFTRDQLLDFYRSEKAQVLDISAYVDALFPDFLQSRPRNAEGFGDVHVFQTQMYVLIMGVTKFIDTKGSAQS